jgi:uncharacterized protein
MTPVPITLTTAAAAVFVNIWLGARIAKYRQQFKVSVGHGGHEPLLRRMRAQANFIENAPFFLILVAALELSGASQLILAIVAAIFVVGRISHAIGMDSADNRRWRMYGMLGTSLTMLALALWALVCVAGLCLGR